MEASYLIEFATSAMLILSGHIQGFQSIFSNCVWNQFLCFLHSKGCGNFQK
jgi:hypothetical protein